MFRLFFQEARIYIYWKITRLYVLFYSKFLLFIKNNNNYYFISIVLPGSAYIYIYIYIYIHQENYTSLLFYSKFLLFLLFIKNNNNNYYFISIVLPRSAYIYILENYTSLRSFLFQILIIY